MQEEEWGQFIDLEIGKPIEKPAIKKKSQVSNNSNVTNSDSTNSDSTNSEPPPPPSSNTRLPKQKKEIQPIISKKLNSLSIIYEEEIWYKRDDEDDDDYGSNWNYIYGGPKKTNFKRKEYINRLFVMYCFICVSFISWSSIVSL
jgi:hypothetical protein